MKKNFIFLILLVFPFKALSHTGHYKNINKIEMEILKDGKVIGYCNYEFFHKDKSLEVQNTHLISSLNFQHFFFFVLDYLYLAEAKVC